MADTSSLGVFRQIRDEIKPIYGKESVTLAMLIVEEVSGCSNTEILTDIIAAVRTNQTITNNAEKC